MVLSDISIRRPVFATVINLVVLLVGIISLPAPRGAADPERRRAGGDGQHQLSRRQRAGDRIAGDPADRGRAVRRRRHRVHAVGQPRAVEPGHDPLPPRPRSRRRRLRRARPRRRRRAASCPTKSTSRSSRSRKPTQQPIIYLAFSSDRHSQVEIADYAERLVKDRVQTIPGVAQAQVYGSTYAMRVWLQPQRLAGFGLTPADVEAALRAQNVEIPAGRVEGSAARVHRAVGNRPEDAGAVRRRSSSATSTATLVRLQRRRQGRARRAGGRASAPATTATTRCRWASSSRRWPIRWTSPRRCKAMLPQITRTLPEGMKVEIAYDSTIFIEKSIDEVYKTVGEAVLLVVLVIFLFLRSWRATLIPLVTIPVSLIGAFGADVRVRLHHQHADPAGDGAGDRPGGRRRDRDAGEHLPPRRGRHAADARRRCKGSKEIGFAIVAMTPDPGRGVRAARVLDRAHRQAVRRVRADPGRRGAGVRFHRADAVADDVRRGCCATRRKHGRFYEAGERVLRWIDRSYRRVLARALRVRWIVVGVGGAGVRAGARPVHAAAAANWRRRRTRASSSASASRRKARPSTTPTSTPSRWKACFEGIPEHGARTSRSSASRRSPTAIGFVDAAATGTSASVSDRRTSHGAAVPAVHGHPRA